MSIIQLIEPSDDVLQQSRFPSVNQTLVRISYHNFRRQQRFLECYLLRILLIGHQRYTMICWHLIDVDLLLIIRHRGDDRTIVVDTVMPFEPPVEDACQTAQCII